MSACNRLDLQTPGTQPVMPKNLLDHWLKLKASGKSPTMLEESKEYIYIEFINKRTT
jgi:hypothetical protein